MICAGDEEFNHRDAVAMSHAVAEAQRKRLAAAIELVAGNLPGAPFTVIVAGQGEFLGLQTLEWMELNPTIVSLAREIGPNVSRSAPAHALAVLAREALHA
jgi:uncharacterized hydantoinase/oxoprolinase family protein